MARAEEKGDLGWGEIEKEADEYNKRLAEYADEAAENEERRAIEAEAAPIIPYPRTPTAVPDVETPPEFRFVNGDELLSKDIPPLEWLVSTIVLRKGITVLTAPYKRGKSLLGLGLAVDLVIKTMIEGHEAEWLGEPITRHGPVVILSGEGGESMIQHRLKQMNPTVSMANLHILAERPLPNLSIEAELRAVYEYAKSVGAVLVVIDPLSRFWSMADENAAGETTEFFARLRAATEDADCGTLAVHHDNKTALDQRGVSFGGRGSSVIANEPDVLIALRPYSEDWADRHKSRVHFLGRWGEPDPGIVEIDTDTLRVEYLGTVSQEGPKAAKRRDEETWILAALYALSDGESGRYHPSATIRDWLAADHEMPPRTFQRIIKGLVEPKHGAPPLVGRVGTGKHTTYCLTEMGRAEAQEIVQ